MASCFLFLLFCICGISGEYLRCQSDSVFWPADQECYKLGTKGPCPNDYEIVVKPEGPLCMPIIGRRRHRNRSNHAKRKFIKPEYELNDVNERRFLGSERRYPFDVHLPEIYDNLSEKEKECYNNHLVYWPRDDRCHKLLSTGPCGNNEWLVLDKTHRFGTQISIFCKERPCPCFDDDLCEVKVHNMTGNCACKVSRAAAQDGICNRGQRLLIDPFGYGQCGCYKGYVLHRGNCYLPHSRGPCSPGNTLQYDKRTGTAECVPSLCPESTVLFRDGRCYTLESKGPCQEGETLQVHKSSGSLVCFGETKQQQKRVFDIIPIEGENEGIIEENIYNSPCILDSRGACRDTFNFNDPRVLKKDETPRSIYKKEKAHFLELPFSSDDSESNIYNKWKVYLIWLRSFANF